MIVDIPTSDEFRNAAADYLNLAWGNAMALALELDDAEAVDAHLRNEDEPTQLDATVYWRAAQRSLSTSVTLLHQGVELFLKGRIAETSPYLLLVGPRNWPGKSNSQDTPFSDFRTIDAQELILVHDTVSPSRLDTTFVARYDALRRRRNMLMHSVRGEAQLEVASLLEDILEMSVPMVGLGKWMEERKRFLEAAPISAIYAEDVDFEDATHFREADLLRRQMSDDCLKRHFAVQKDLPFYICPECFLWSESRNRSVQARTAQLRPTDASSTRLYCIACSATVAVERLPCQEPGCGNDVMAVDGGGCLLCGCSQDGQ